MKARVLLLVFWAAACGSEPLPVVMNPDPQNMNMNTSPLPIAGKIFELEGAAIFGLESSFELEIGELLGFQIRSLSNSDEATGTMSAQSPCRFTVSSSSFPGELVLKAGAVLMDSCTFDQEKKELTLGQDKSVSCYLPEDGGPC